MEIFDWDVAAAGNGFSAPDGFPEGMNYSDVNNAAREIMAVQARQYADTNGSLITGGSGNAFTLAANRTIGAYGAGQQFRFRADRANTGAVTLNVDSIGAAAVVRQDGTALIANDIRTNGIYDVVYSPALTSWVIYGQLATSTARGIVELATSTEVIAGTDTTRAVTSEGATKLFSDATRRTLGTNGYQRLPGGLMIQWGQVAIGSDSTVGVFFSPTFTSIYHFGWLLSAAGRSDGSGGTRTFSGLTTASVNIDNGADLAGTAHWFAIGI